MTQKLAAPNQWGQDVYLPADADKLRIKVFPDEFPKPKPKDDSPRFESQGAKEKADKVDDRKRSTPGDRGQN